MSTCSDDVIESVIGTFSEYGMLRICSKIETILSWVSRLFVHSLNFYQQQTALNHISKKIPGSKFSFRVLIIQSSGQQDFRHLMTLISGRISPEEQVKRSGSVIRSRQEKIFAVPPAGFPAD
jgi:hypothetical protein